jgi:cytochrome P450
MFRGRNFKGPHGVLLTSMQSKAALFMTQLHAHATQPGGGRQELDMQERYFNLTLDAIGHMAFGMDLGALRGESLEFQQAFDACQQYMNVLMLSTVNVGDWALLYLTPKGRAFRRNVAIIDKWAFRIIDKARRQGREASKTPGDGEEEEEEGGGEYEGSLLRVFLDPSRPDEHGQPFSLHYIKDILMSFIIAGRDTTAEALTWATYLLATHPHALAEVRREAAAALRKGQGGRWEMGHEELESLVYLHAAVTETLRLYPSVPKEFRTATEDDVLPDGTKVGHSRSPVCIAIAKRFIRGY